MTQTLRKLAFFALLATSLTWGSNAFALDVGDDLPSGNLTSLDGDSYDPAGQSGYVVLIYFMGPGCGICVDIANQIQSSFVNEYASERFLVLGIDSLDGTPEDLIQLREAAGARFPFLTNGSDYLTSCGLDWHSFLIVDSSGVVRYVSEGADVSSYDEDAMTEVVEVQLGRAADAVQKTWGEIKQLFDR